MENNNQRIIFDLPEEISSAKVVYDILQKNGMPEEDFEGFLDDQTKITKSGAIINYSKDLFDKKISEQKMSELIQSDLKISKEKADAIVSDIKLRLIPFAKKITIPSGTVQTTPFAGITVQKPESPFEIFERERPAQEMPEKPSNIQIPATKPVSDFEKTAPVAKPKPKKIIEPQMPKPTMPQKKGPDSYREPIG